MTFLLRSLIFVYRYTALPVLLMLGTGHCRFTPSCSDYALEAVHRHGALRGSVLAAKRICRCHPFAEAGADPVPATPVCLPQENRHGR